MSERGMGTGDLGRARRQELGPQYRFTTFMCRIRSGISPDSGGIVATVAAAMWNQDAAPGCSLDVLFGSGMDIPRNDRRSGRASPR